MSEHKLWIRDIERLRELGRNNITQLAEDVYATRVRVDSLNLDPAAFGENPVREEMEKAYEAAKAEFSKQLNAAHKGLRDSGDAVARAAEHYKAIEKKLSS